MIMWKGPERRLGHRALREELPRLRQLDGEQGKWWAWVVVTPCAKISHRQGGADGDAQPRGGASVTREGRVKSSCYLKGVRRSPWTRLGPRTFVSIGSVNAQSGTRPAHGAS